MKSVTLVLTPRWDLPGPPFEPLCQAPLDALSFTGLGVCQARLGLTALSVSPSCLLLRC